MKDTENSLLSSVDLNNDEIDLFQPLIAMLFCILEKEILRIKRH